MVSSRATPMKAVSVSGSSRCTAFIIPSPARRIGTTTGHTATRRAGAAPSGVRTGCVDDGERPARLVDQHPGELVHRLAEGGAVGGLVSEASEQLARERVVDDGHGHRPA